MPARTDARGCIRRYQLLSVRSDSDGRSAAPAMDDPRGLRGGAAGRLRRAGRCAIRRRAGRARRPKSGHRIRCVFAVAQCAGVAEPDRRLARPRFAALSPLADSGPVRGRIRRVAAHFGARRFGLAQLRADRQRQRQPLAARLRPGRRCRAGAVHANRLRRVRRRTYRTSRGPAAPVAHGIGQCRGHCRAFRPCGAHASPFRHRAGGHRGQPQFHHRKILVRRSQAGVQLSLVQCGQRHRRQDRHSDVRQLQSAGFRLVFWPREAGGAEDYRHRGAGRRSVRSKRQFGGNRVGHRTIRRHGARRQHRIVQHPGPDRRIDPGRADHHRGKQ